MLLTKLELVEQSQFLENILVSGCASIEKYANGTRKIMGYQPNLTGYHMVLRNKLKSKRHILASKSLKLS
jgi:hypothetical protein